MEFYKYKGYPLVRMGKEMYYGNPGDEFVVHVVVTSTKSFGGIAVSDKVSLQLVRTDVNIDPAKMIEKATVRNGMTEVMEVAYDWLRKYTA